jgi:putative transcriptional regulator
MTNNLKVQRVQKNIGQSELAEKLGVSRQTIHSIESGKFVPSTLLALKLALALETTVENIFRLEEDD